MPMRSQVLAGNKSSILQMRPDWALPRITCSTAACCAPLPREERTEFSARPRSKLGLCNLIATINGEFHLTRWFKVYDGKILKSITFKGTPFLGKTCILRY